MHDLLVLFIYSYVFSISTRPFFPVPVHFSLSRKCFSFKKNNLLDLALRLILIFLSEKMSITNVNRSSFFLFECWIYYDFRNVDSGVFGNQDLFLPLLLPKIPGRLYYLFGKPIVTRGRQEILKDKKNADQLYNHVKSEVERSLAYLINKRKEDPYRSFIDRTMYKAIYSSQHEVPTFDPWELIISGDAWSLISNKLLSSPFFEVWTLLFNKNQFIEVFMSMFAFWYCSWIQPFYLRLNLWRFLPSNNSITICQVVTYKEDLNGYELWAWISFWSPIPAWRRCLYYKQLRIQRKSKLWLNHTKKSYLVNF